MTLDGNYDAENNRMSLERSDATSSGWPAGVRLLAASEGNEFMLQIAEMLAWGFAELTVPCELAVDEPPVATAGHVLQIVVAPHEYVPLFLERQPDVDVRSALAHTWVLNVEQPGSAWFEMAWRFGCHARGFFDISRPGMCELRRRGARVAFTPLGYAPFLTAPEPPDTRDVDILFLGHSSPRREAFLARHSRFLARHRCALHLVPVNHPRHHGAPGYVSGQARAALLARSRILLNIHSTDRHYFELHRAMLALANGCLLVTETCEDTAPLSEGVHFVAATLDGMEDACEQALASASRTSIAEAGRRFVIEQFTASQTARQMLQSATEGCRRDDELLMDARPGGVDARMGVRSRIASAQRDRTAGVPTHDDQRNDAYTQSIASPSITVLVTLYNYERYIDTCLGSVESSSPVPGGIELLVVDDASTDDSVAAVRRFMRRTGVPTRLLVKHENTGPADARNLGLAEARGASVFVLDADNAVYPNGLGYLWAALVDSGAAAAYGIISTFDDETGESIGLLSQFAWDPRALVRAPYIDAMALFDRDILRNIGGYAVGLIEYGWFGWEDYCLWLTLAERSYEAAFVPNIVASYRVHGRSMLRHTNETAASLARYFERRFAGLVARYPDLDSCFGFPRAGTGASPSPLVADQDAAILERRCEALEFDLRALRRSASWRITAPMRAAYRLVTGRP